MSAPEPSDAVNELKERGNGYFKGGDYALALSYYGKAIEQASSEGCEFAVLYTNRATAHFQMGEFVES